jgi:DNA-binding CsgD family transcriptional regulator
MDQCPAADAKRHLACCREKHMTRLLYLPDDATVIQLEVDLAPAELVSAVNAGLRPLPILRSAPAGPFSAVQVNTTVVIAPTRAKGRPRRSAEKSDLTRRQRQVLELSTRGFSSDEIAAMLDLSRRTVNYHLNQVRRRVRGESSERMKTDYDDMENNL